MQLKRFILLEESTHLLSTELQIEHNQVIADVGNAVMWISFICNFTSHSLILPEVQISIIPPEINSDTHFCTNCSPLGGKL
jgi:hypothetical protein